MIFSGEILVPIFKVGMVLDVEGQKLTILDIEEYTDSGTDDYGYPCSVHLIYATKVDTGNPALNVMVNAALESGELRIEHHFEKEKNEGDYYVE